MKTSENIRNRQGGAVAIIVGVSLVLLVGFLALVIDLGHLYLAKTGLQNAADAAALSGAKQLNGTAAGICCDANSAVGRAIDTAGRNTFFGDLGQEQVALGDSVASNPYIRLSNSPDGSDGTGGNWGLSIVEAMASPGDKYFIKVDTASGNLQAMFAPVWAAIGGGISTMGTGGLAVAGRYPPGALVPMFVPVVRRNADPDPLPPDQGQVSGTPCSGAIFNDKDYMDYATPNKCPQDLGGVDPNNYRKPDYSGNWGFLKANECRWYGDNGSPLCSQPKPDVNAISETGSYYVITPRANNKWDDGSAYVWQVGTSWTGNFGFMLKSADEKTQKSIMAALCRGGGMMEYSVPGCGEVHTGQMSGPKTADNLNTRFDLQGNQTQLPHEFCPSDTNIYYSSTWTSSGYLTGYQAGPPTPPTQFPPGKANRRIVRVYVVDNVWLPGYNDASPNDNSCTIDASKKSLTGGSEQAHLVGCADFFMWKPADSQGALYAEYVGAVNVKYCNAAPAAYSDIRLFR